MKNHVTVDQVEVRGTMWQLIKWRLGGLKVIFYLYYFLRNFPYLELILNFDAKNIIKFTSL